MSNKSNTVDVIWLSEQIGRPSIYNIVHKIIALVERGEINSGTSLPSIRMLAKQLNLSSTTVATAINELKARNIIRTKPGYGTMVIDNPITDYPLRFTDFCANKNLYTLLDLTYSEPDYNLLPKIDKAVEYALKNSTMNRTKHCPIIPELKMAALSSWPYPAQNFIALHSSFEAISYLLKIFVPAGAWVAIEDPTLVNVLDTLKRSNIKIIPVECDNEGPTLESLTKALSKKPALFIYQPREHHITGNSVSEKRLQAMVKVFDSAKVKPLIIEHDVIGGLSCLNSASIGRYLPDNTLCIRSYFRVFSPDLCVALLSGPGRIIQQLHHYRLYSLGWGNQLLQQALAYLLQDEKSLLKVKRAKEIYIKRYNALLDALKKHHIYLPRKKGLHLCLWLPVPSERQALVLLESKGIIALGGSTFMVTQSKSRQEYIRLRVSQLATKSLINQVADAVSLVLTMPVRTRVIN